MIDHLEYYYRTREVRYILDLSPPKSKPTQRKNLLRQISRLCRPLSASNSFLSLDSGEDEDDTQPPPLYGKPDTPPYALFPQNSSNEKGDVRGGHYDLGAGGRLVTARGVFRRWRGRRVDCEEMSENKNESGWVVEECTTPTSPIR
jgi:hypothetical protein